MRRAAKFLSYLSALCGVLVAIKSPSGLLGGMLWLPKLWAGAWAPFLAIAGGVGALLGLRKGEPSAVWTGLLGAFLGASQVQSVIQQQAPFEQTFGLDWEQRIPVDLRTRMGKKRYQLIQPRSVTVPVRLDVPLGVSGIGETLLADLYEPSPGVPRTGLAVIYLHGSLWQAVDKGFFVQPLFQRLTGQGHAILELAYSLAPQADLFAMLADVRQAIGWLKRHSQDLNINPDKVVLMGPSGGGHLALLTAYTSNHPVFQLPNIREDISVCGVISLYGPTDLDAFFHEYGRSNPRQPETSAQIRDELRPRLHDRTALERWLTRRRIFPAYRHANLPGGALLLVYLLGGTLNEIPERYRLCSPIQHAGPDCPPTLQFFGSEDFVIDVSHGRRLHEKLRAAGAVSFYVEYPQTVHAFDHYFGVSRRVAPAAQSAAYDIERFLALLLI
jgi:acetyl esterase/lipase